MTTSPTLPSPAQYLNEDEVSVMLHVGIRTLQSWRLSRKVLPYVKIGRTVRYPVAKIEAYLAQHTITPTD